MPSAVRSNSAALDLASMSPTPRSRDSQYHDEIAQKIHQPTKNLLALADGSHVHRFILAGAKAQQGRAFGCPWVGQSPP